MYLFAGVHGRIRTCISFCLWWHTSTSSCLWTSSLLSNCFYIFMKSAWRRRRCSITVPFTTCLIHWNFWKMKIMVCSWSGDIFTEFLASAVPEKCSQTSLLSLASRSEVPLLPETPPCTSGSCSRKGKRSRRSWTYSDHHVKMAQ